MAEGVSALVKEAKSKKNIITLEATVVTGFEKLAKDECKEKCKPVNVSVSKGRIFFNVLITHFPEVLKLRAVDNLYLVNEAVDKVEFHKDKDKDLSVIKNLTNCVDWKMSLSVWSKLVGFNGVLFPGTKPKMKVESRAPSESTLDMESSAQALRSSSELRDNMKPHEIQEFVDDCKRRLEAVSYENLNKVEKPEVDPNVLKFRATCNRTGEHSFSSMEAAADFGGALQDKFNWTVDLTRFNLNVVLNISAQSCYVCSALTSKSLHRRNISHFGSTTLRSTLCYGMVRLAEPENGDIVVDPLCGSGSIPIEGALGYPSTFFLGGDKDKKAMFKTRANIEHLNKSGSSINVDPIRWSSKCLPLRDETVDIFVTDLPFGKRSGRKSENLSLYRCSLEEMARVVRRKTGRASILTNDKTSFMRALSHYQIYWKLSRTLAVNQGGLFSTVFLLHRTAALFSSEIGAV